VIAFCRVQDVKIVILKGELLVEPVVQFVVDLVLLGLSFFILQFEKLE